MFFKQVRRNAAKNRKGNGLFFGSLVVAIVAFYTLLSLESQDVMRYLATVESDAVLKLMRLLSGVYGVSLFFVFFLVYFACNYQINNRKQELGTYLMLGMRRTRLFFMLFCETLWSSMVALAIGLPIALFLTEGISLTTAKVVGLGIIGHQFSISLPAIFWTVCGFLFVQLFSMLVLCVGIGKVELAELLNPEQIQNKRELSGTSSVLSFLFGLGFLLVAYYLGIFRMRSLSLGVAAFLIFFGISGTFLFYRGLGGFLGLRIQRKNPNATGLQTFTARQVQETVIAQDKSLAIASLLLTMALASISYGISMGTGRTEDSRCVDFSIFGTEEQVKAILEQDNVKDSIETSYPLYLSRIKDEYLFDKESALDTTSITEELGKIKDATGLAENIKNNFHMEYVISESSYNELLKSMGKEEIHLEGDKVALYSSMQNDGNFSAVMERVVKKGLSLGKNGSEYEILPAFYEDKIVADRSITLYMALIVPDSLYKELAQNSEAYCQNIRLSDNIVEKLGLMQAIQKMDTYLAGTGMEYDSYLKGIGRNLFYMVGASYLTIYLGVLFWLIANTVIGLKYLISQRQTKHRYETLFMLGADVQEMEKSVKKQISIYFIFVLSVALASSIAAIFTMFTSFTRLPAGTSLKTIVILSIVALGVFALIEIFYINLVKRMAEREIRQLELTHRR